MTKSIAKNSLYNFILKFFRLIVPVIVGSYVVHTLDTQLYADFLSASTWVDFAIIFGTFGVTAYGIREGAQARDSQERATGLFSSLFTINLITNGAVLIAYMAVVLFSMQSMTRTIYLVLGFKILANMFLVEWLNEALENYRFITVKTILVRIIYAILIFALIRSPEDVVRYCGIIILTDLLNNLASFFYIRKRIPLSFRHIEIGRHIGPLVSMLLISNVNILYTQLDKILLDRTVGSMSLAMYRIPQDITNMIFNLLISVVMVAVPRLSYYHGNGQQKEYDDLLDRSYHSFMLVIFPACMGFACLSQEIMRLYSGAAYDAAIPVLAIFALRTIESAVYAICANQIFFVYNQEKYLVRILLICGLLNAGLDILMIAIGHFTPVTAVLTTLFSELVLMGIMFWYIQKRLGIAFRFFTRSNVKYMLLSLTFVPITMLVHSFDFSARLGSDTLGMIANAAVIMAVCIPLYFGVLLLMKDSTMKFLADKALSMVRRGR